MSELCLVKDAGAVLVLQIVWTVGVWKKGPLQHGAALLETDLFYERAGT